MREDIGKRWDRVSGEEAGYWFETVALTVQAGSEIASDAIDKAWDDLA
jgi:hypothetical protein